MNLINYKLRGINPIYLSFEESFSPNDQPPLRRTEKLNNYPCYFLKERIKRSGEPEKDTTVYDFCITGISKNELNVIIEDKKIQIFKKEDNFLICRAAINKYDKLNLKAIKASLNDGILSVSFKHKNSEKISVNIE